MADIQVANSDDDLSGNTLLTEEEAYTITGLHTYNRSTNPPFAVVSGAAKVDNLDADKLDGETGTYYAVAANVLLKDGSVALMANWDVGDYQIRANNFYSDVATGSAPLHISSTTLVTNLNADILDGQQGSYYLAAANATGTLAVNQGGTGAATLADDGLLMGNGTSAVTQAFGISGYDATYPILNFQGATPALYLTDTASTRQVQLKHAVTSSTESLVILYGSEPSYATGQNLAYWDTDTGENTILASANNLKLTNAAGVEHTRVGPNGISFDGGTNNLGRYEEGTFTPYYKEATTTTGQVAGTGRYLKIGDMITINMHFNDVTSGASGGTSYGIISGIPSIENAGSIGTPATTNLPTSGEDTVLYLTGTLGYFYYMNNNTSWGAELFRNSTSGIYIQTNNTYKIA